MTRIRSRRALFNSRPFAGEGVSLYATIGTSAQYRNLRIPRGTFVKGQGGEFGIGAASIPKTARRASAASPATSIDWAHPAAFASETVSYDVRTYRDDVENESENYRTQTHTLDASKDIITEILGTATLLDREPRQGGIVRIRFVWKPNRVGTQPAQFVAIRTAGPTSPANATVSYGGGLLMAIVEIDTPALSDSAPYTYTIRAENGLITADVLTGITVQADATGPLAPTGSATAW